MPTLIDTNVLPRSVQPSHRMHPVAVRALEIPMKREEPLIIAVQNVAEFWNSTLCEIPAFDTPPVRIFNPTSRPTIQAPDTPLRLLGGLCD